MFAALSYCHFQLGDKPSNLGGPWGRVVALTCPTLLCEIGNDTAGCRLTHVLRAADCQDVVNENQPSAFHSYISYALQSGMDMVTPHNGSSTNYVMIVGEGGDSNWCNHGVVIGEREGVSSNVTLHTSRQGNDQSTI